MVAQSPASVRIGETAASGVRARRGGAGVVRREVKVLREIAPHRRSEDDGEGAFPHRCFF